MADRETLLAVLDLARWAPSGDNTQPWRFEIVDGEHIAIHGFDTREHVIYDFDGHASHMAHGALLETLRIAATGFGLTASWTIRPAQPDTRPIYDVSLKPQPGGRIDALFPYIKTRVVQRRPMRTTPLTAEQREALIAAPGAGYRVALFESPEHRRGFARLLWDNAYIRLTCPEAWAVHRAIIEWGAQYSKDRLPERAVGVDPVTAKLMRWVMQRWERVEFFNRYLMGTIAPRIQLDLVPALRCAAHAVVISNSRLTTTADYVNAGAAMQRFWLAATSVGLYLQPQMTPILFRQYAKAGRSMSSLPEIDRRVKALAVRLEALVRLSAGEDLVLLSRIGSSPPPPGRSLRKDLDELTKGG